VLPVLGIVNCQIMGISAIERWNILADMGMIHSKMAVKWEQYQ
jgi:hypothetical protein